MATLTTAKALALAMAEEMEKDSRIVVWGEEVAAFGGTYGATSGLLDKFGPTRVLDTPISEGVIVGAAVGAAMNGLRPIAEIMGINFAFLAMDQILNHAAKVRSMFGGQFECPLVVRTTSGGGRQLAATHSQTFEHVFAHFPGLLVVAPSTPADAKGLLKTSIRCNDPVMFIEQATMYSDKGDVPDDPEYLLPIGKCDLKRPGKDVTLVTYSKMVSISLKAAQQLAAEGIECEVIDLRWLRPLDMETIYTSFKKTNRAVIVEEGWATYGLSAEIAARIYAECFDYLDAPIQRVAQKEAPLPYSAPLEKYMLPKPEDVIAAVRKVI
ncbi:MAG TPA: alpha-ketoacid dehydrogenase subunit beta [Anaerolineales bacterium]|nr:alpha-ketoacid dehydrogenase subunit beta [Anaerolineales bacterium]